MNMHIFFCLLRQLCFTYHKRKFSLQFQTARSTSSLTSSCTKHSNPTDQWFLYYTCYTASEILCKTVGTNNRKNANKPL